MRLLDRLKGYIFPKKEIYESLLSSINIDPSAFILCNKQGVILFKNQSAGMLFSNIALRQSIFTYLRSPVIKQIVTDITNNHSRIFQTELSLHAPHKMELIVHIIKADKNILFRFEDITAQKKSRKMHQDFVANVSHELRTPLASIIGFVETLQGPAKQDVKAHEQFLSIMYDQATRMKFLIDGLLSLSRVEMDKHILPTQDCNITTTLQDVSKAIMPLLEAKSIGLKITFDEIDRFIIGDSKQIFQIFQNITENAIKYSPENTEITYKIEDHKNEYAVHIMDQGQGIDKDHIPRLTERFYRADDARNRSEGGAGLGLSIVSKIIERHKGRLDIISEKLKGSDFIITLPKSENHDH